MRSPALLAGFAALLIFANVSCAQIVEARQIDGKQVWCAHSGAMSIGGDCGGKANWYAYVLVGTISAITPAANDEKQLEIVPEEVFHGNPDSPITVLTSQGLCLPKMEVGDRWLFFLRKENGKPIVLDYYGNDSRPVAEADRQIDVLRRLKTVGDAAIIRGRVLQSYSPKQSPVPQATVRAHLQTDDRQFLATTDQDGYYEFQPLPPGRYSFSVDPVGSLRFDDSAPASWPVSAGSCFDLTLLAFPHAELGGHVRRMNGSPISRAEVIITRVNNNSGYSSAYTDENGHYSVNSLKPGNYLVGVNLPGSRPSQSKDPKTGVITPVATRYYRDAADASSAMPISLADGDKRDDIDFLIPDR